MSRILIVAAMVCFLGISANVSALSTYYYTNAIYDVYGAHQQVQGNQSIPFSTVISKDGKVYSQVHHTGNQLAVEANIDGWAAGNSYYEFTVFDATNPGAEGTALLRFSGSAFAAATDGYARAFMQFQGFDPSDGGPWYQPWSGNGSGLNGIWYFSDTNVDIGYSTDYNGRGTGVESVDYDVNWRVRYNERYRINLFAHATAWSSDTPNLDYSARAYIDPLIGLPEGVGITMADLGDNPDFPLIVMPNTDNPYGEFQPVPIPATILLLGSGLIGIAGARRKIFKK